MLSEYDKTVHLPVRTIWVWEIATTIGPNPVRSKACAVNLGFFGMNCIAILASATMTKRVKLCARPIDQAKGRSRNVNRYFRIDELRY